MRIFPKLRLLFFPLSICYGLIVALRNRLFDRDLIKVQDFAVPVISVGNLTAGGTGKTPIIMHLIEVVGKSFKKPAVVTRGYGRKSKGCIVVSDGDGYRITVSEGGDEPLLIARKHPQAVVIVSERRAEGIHHAIEHFGCDVIFLDDAFQHRFVRRNCDIVLINAREGWQGTQLLPMGRLREPLRNLNRADIVVITKGSTDENERIRARIREHSDLPLFYAEFSGAALTKPDFSTTLPLSTLYEKKIACFCGIAHPADFLSELRKSDADICAFLTFPDHYHYSDRDIYRIIKSAKNAGCDMVITTEKDMIRCNTKLFSGIELLALRLRVSVNPEFQEIVRTFIDKGVSY